MTRLGIEKGIATSIYFNLNMVSVRISIASVLSSSCRLQLCSSRRRTRPPATAPAGPPSRARPPTSAAQAWVAAARAGRGTCRRARVGGPLPSDVLVAAGFARNRRRSRVTRGMGEDSRVVTVEGRDELEERNMRAV